MPRWTGNSLCSLWFDTLNRQFIIIYTVIFKSFNNSSSGVNLNPYSVFFFGVILTPKRSLKNSFSGVKSTLDLELIPRS